MALTGYNVFAFNAYTFWDTHQDATEVYLPDILHWYVDLLSADLHHQCKLVWVGTSSTNRRIIDENEWASADQVYVLLSDMQGEEPNFVNSLNPNGEDTFIFINFGNVTTDNFVTTSHYIGFHPGFVNVSCDSNGVKHAALSGFGTALLSNGEETFYQTPSDCKSPLFGKSDNDLSDTYAVNQNQAQTYIQKTSFGFIGGIVSGQKGSRVNWDKYDEYFMLAGDIALELYNKADPTDRKWCKVEASPQTNPRIIFPGLSNNAMIEEPSGLIGEYNTSVVKLIPFSMGYYVNDDFYLIPVSSTNDGNNAVYSYIKEEKDYMMKNAIQVGSDHYTLIRYRGYYSSAAPILCVKNGEQC